MTGLDHTRDRIVEIATIVTDDELRIIAEGPDLVVHADDEVLAAMDPVVVEMHTKSGLLAAIRASTVTIEEAGRQTLDFIKAHVPDPRTVPLCGNSIGTDRRFLDKYLPEIENYLHYRSVDVSSVKELVKRWYPDLTQGMPRKAGLHRALDDIRSSIEELRYYRGVVFVPPIAWLAGRARRRQRVGVADARRRAHRVRRSGGAPRQRGRRSRSRAGRDPRRRRAHGGQPRRRPAATRSLRRSASAGGGDPGPRVRRDRGGLRIACHGLVGRRCRDGHREWRLLRRACSSPTPARRWRCRPGSTGATPRPSPRSSSRRGTPSWCRAV